MDITREEVAAENYFMEKPDMVVLFGKLAMNVIRGYISFSQDAPGTEEFLAEFEVPENFYLGDENESFNDYITRMHVIVRKSDGQMFGFKHWADTINQDVDYDSNAYQHDIEIDTTGWTDEDWGSSYPSPFVFLPIVPFTITGYKYA